LLALAPSGGQPVFQRLKELTMPSADPTPATLEREYDVLIARSGLTIAPDRRAIMLKCYADVRGWSDIIRSTRRAPSVEPANVYGLQTISRALVKDAA
jgi:hypothetical protein